MLQNESCTKSAMNCHGQCCQRPVFAEFDTVVAVPIVAVLAVFDATIAAMVLPRLLMLPQLTLLMQLLQSVVL